MCYVACAMLSDAARCNISTASASEINPAVSSSSSKLSSTATTPSLSDLKHIRFDRDDSIINLDDKFNFRLSFSSMSNVSLDDIAAERSFGRTPFFSNRWAGTPKSESAVPAPIVHGSPEVTLHEGNGVDTPYVSAFLTKRAKEKRQALEAGSDAPSFEGLSPVFDSASMEQQSKRRRS